jgi:hypothetical protein
MAEHRLPKQITYLQRSKAVIQVHNPYDRFGSLAASCTATWRMTAFRPEADIFHCDFSGVGCLHRPTADIHSTSEGFGKTQEPSSISF